MIPKSEELEQQIKSTEEKLRQIFDEQDKIGGRIGFLKDELTGLEWLRASGDGRASRRYEQASNEVATLTKQFDDRQTKAEATEAELLDLREALAKAQIDEATQEAQRAELAWYEAWLEVLELRETLNQAERKRRQTKNEFDEQAQHVRGLGSNYPEGMAGLLDGDETARGELQKRIERLRLEAQPERVS